MAPVKPKIEDWARLAAFIDGEGCIEIFRQVNTHRKPKLHASHRLRIVVTNTDPRLPKWLQQRFGGKACPLKDRRSRRPCFQWKTFGEEAEVILRGCLPFFVIKREQAEIGIALRETYTKKDSLRGRLPEGVVEIRENYREQLKQIRRPKVA